MTPILSRRQIRAYDAFAIERGQVPGVVLMENAGRGAAEAIAELVDVDDPGPVIIVCGRGNNGGDGFVVARHLLARGIDTECVLLATAERVQGDARLNLDALVGLGGTVHEDTSDEVELLRELLDEAQLCVDALFGTGLDRAVSGAYAAAIDAINEAGNDCMVVSLDIPSGLDADSGAVLGVAVRADSTLTFATHKAGLLQGAAAAHTGDIEVIDLGIFDGEVLAHTGWLARFIEPEQVLEALGVRAPDAHKYDSGSVLVIGGSRGKTGAALLAGQAALRAGAGLATIATWPDAVASLETRVREVMTVAIDPDDLDASLAAALDRRRAVAIGPGLGLDEHARALCDRVVLGFEGPVVVDADAISGFAGRPEALAAAKGPRLLTPHTGELARLLGRTSADIERDRFAAVRDAARLCGATVVLKGRHTLIASDERIDVCPIGNQVLATAGSGDVLTGIAAALCCGAPTHEAACAAVYLHALTADRWRDELGADRGMLAGDLVDGLPLAIAALGD